MRVHGLKVRPPVHRAGKCQREHERDRLRHQGEGRRDRRGGARH